MRSSSARSRASSSCPEPPRRRSNNRRVRRARLCSRRVTAWALVGVPCTGAGPAASAVGEQAAKALGSGPQAWASRARYRTQPRIYLVYTSRIYDAPHLHGIHTSACVYPQGAECIWRIFRVPRAVCPAVACATLPRLPRRGTNAQETTQEQSKHSRYRRVASTAAAAPRTAPYQRVDVLVVEHQRVQQPLPWSS